MVEWVFSYKPSLLVNSIRVYFYFNCKQYYSNGYFGFISRPRPILIPRFEWLLSNITVLSYSQYICLNKGNRFQRDGEVNQIWNWSEKSTKTRKWMWTAFNCFTDNRHRLIDLMGGKIYSFVKVIHIEIIFLMLVQFFSHSNSILTLVV